VRTGPYRYSRNPIYLSFSLLQLGVAFWVNSLWLFVTLMPAVALMSFVVIPREEHYLESRFPSDYLLSLPKNLSGLIFLALTTRSPDTALP
jgi:protein-S-isoprenylcysteine O-methyltransferase Ste14